jgi:fatty acid-binding protein DegV
LRDGGVERLALPRSDRSALRRVVAESNRIGLTGSTRRVVFHAGCVDRAEALVGMIGGADHVTEFSPAMTIHTGPGVVGVAWIGARAEGPIGAGP